MTCKKLTLVIFTDIYLSKIIVLRYELKYKHVDAHIRS